MKHFLIAVLIGFPAAAFAVGDDSDAPPKQTNTTQTCTKGQIWSEESKSCVDPVQGSVNDDILYRAAREFAYAGRYDDARRALAAMSDPQDDRVLTYLGFIHRKTGDAAMGNAYYRQAIAKNPDNLLARSYMGLGHVEAGDLAAARAQLREIRARNGRGTWAEVALRRAIENGSAPSY